MLTGLVFDLTLCFLLHLNYVRIKMKKSRSYELISWRLKIAASLFLKKMRNGFRKYMNKRWSVTISTLVLRFDPLCMKAFLISLGQAGSSSE